MEGHGGIDYRPFSSLFGHGKENQGFSFGYVDWFIQTL